MSKFEGGGSMSKEKTIVSKSFLSSFRDFYFLGVWGCKSGHICQRSYRLWHLLQFLTLFDKIQGGSDEWVWGVKSHIFGICQKVVFRHKNGNGFLSNLGGVRAILTFVKIFLVFFWRLPLMNRDKTNLVK